MVKIGVCGFVGSGKIVLIEVLMRYMLKDYDMVVIINDIYMKEDVEFMCKNLVML